MAKRTFHIAMLLFALISLSACGARHRALVEVPTLYEIDNAVVTGNIIVSSDLARGVQSRMSSTLQSSSRPLPLPRATIDIHLMSSVTVKRIEGFRTESQLSVALTDTAGYPVQIRNFTILSFSADHRAANEAAAEAIVSRLRIEYSLSQPRLRDAAIEPADLSTRMASESRPSVPTQENAQSEAVPVKLVSVPETPDQTTSDKKTSSVQETIQKPTAVTSDPLKDVPENGARIKIVIQPSISDLDPSTATTEPCKETLENKCN